MNSRQANRLLRLGWQSRKSDLQISLLTLDLTCSRLLIPADLRFRLNKTIRSKTCAIGPEDSFGSRSAAASNSDKIYRPAAAAPKRSSGKGSPQADLCCSISGEDESPLPPNPLLPSFSSQG